MNGEQETSTRTTILRLMKTRGEMSVSELSRHLGITEMAVRRHVNTLERDGLIHSELVRQAMGRPTHMFSLTDRADELFPKNYHTLALDLLGELDVSDGDDPVAVLFERRKERLARKYAVRMNGKSLADRVESLAEIQNAAGYMADWEAMEDGSYELREFNCPISQVAAAYNQACQCELTLFEQLLGAKVERTECLAKSGGKCVYVIRPNAV